MDSIRNNIRFKVLNYLLSFWAKARVVVALPPEAAILDGMCFSLPGSHGFGIRGENGLILCFSLLFVFFLRQRIFCFFTFLMRSSSLFLLFSPLLSVFSLCPFSFVLSFPFFSFTCSFPPFSPLLLSFFCSRLTSPTPLIFWIPSDQPEGRTPLGTRLVIIK